MLSECFDLLPGGGPAYAPDMIGANGRISRLYKGASKPDDPPPQLAPVQADDGAEADVSRTMKRKKGLKKTMLETAAMPATQTLGKDTRLGVSSPPQTPMYGGEP